MIDDQKTNICKTFLHLKILGEVLSCTKGSLKVHGGYEFLVDIMLSNHLLRRNHVLKL